MQSVGALNVFFICKNKVKLESGASCFAMWNVSYIERQLEDGVRWCPLQTSAKLRFRRALAGADEENTLARSSLLL